MLKRCIYTLALCLTLSVYPNLTTATALCDQVSCDSDSHSMNRTIQTSITWERANRNYLRQQREQRIAKFITIAVPVALISYIVISSRPAISTTSGHINHISPLLYKDKQFSVVGIQWQYRF